MLDKQSLNVKSKFHSEMDDGVLYGLQYIVVNVKLTSGIGKKNCMKEGQAF